MIGVAPGEWAGVVPGVQQGLGVVRHAGLQLLRTALHAAYKGNLTCFRSQRQRGDHREVVN
jgi:hypothetical protein